MGVVSAGLRFAEFNWINEAWLANSWSQAVALLAYILLITYFIKACLKVKQ